MLTFASVPYKAALFYGTTVQSMNWLALVFNFANIPFGTIAVLTLEKYGLKAALLLGTWSVAIGNAIKILR